MFVVLFQKLLINETFYFSGFPVTFQNSINEWAKLLEQSCHVIIYCKYYSRRLRFLIEKWRGLPHVYYVTSSHIEEILIIRVHVGSRTANSAYE